MITGPIRVQQVLRLVLSPPAVVAATLAILTVRLFINTAHYSLNVLFWDQWDAYLPLFRGMDIISAFRLQHGVHRMGLGILLDGLVLWLTRWDGVALSYLMAVVLIATGVVAIVGTARLFGRLVHADIALPLLLVSFRPYESIVIVPLSSASILPLFLLVCIALILSVELASIRWLLCGLLIPALVFTGYGVCVGPVLVALAIGLVGRPRGIVGSIVILGSLIASYVWFLKDFRMAANVPNFVFPHPRPWEYLTFIAIMYANLAGLKGVSCIVIVVGIIIGVLVGVATCANYYWLFRERYNSAVMASCFVLGGFSLTYAALTAVGRISLGLGAGQASRYVTLLLPSLVALYWTSRQLYAAGRIRAPLWGIVGFALLVNLGMTGADWAELDHFYRGKRAWAIGYLRGEDIEQAEALSEFQIHPDPVGTGLGQKLAFLKTHGLNMFNGRGPGGPMRWPEDLVRSGDFSRGLDDQAWQPVIEDACRAAPAVENRLEPVQVSGTGAVRFLRRNSESTPCQMFLHQEVNRDVSDLLSLRLVIEFRIDQHSLSGGGYLGSEYPVQVRMLYRGADGGERLWVRGFYIQNLEGRRTDHGVKVDGGRWVEYTVPDAEDPSLLALAGGVRYIRWVEVMASGHDFEAYVRRISLLGQ